MIFVHFFKWKIFRFWEKKVSEIASEHHSNTYCLGNLQKLESFLSHYYTTLQIKAYRNWNCCFKSSLKLWEVLISWFRDWCVNWQGVCQLVLQFAGTCKLVRFVFDFVSLFKIIVETLKRDLLGDWMYTGLVEPV